MSKVTDPNSTLLTLSLDDLAESRLKKEDQVSLIIFPPF